MLFYQVVIMLFVLLMFCLITFVIRIKNHTILAVSIVAIAVIGAGSLFLVQSFFETRFYSQNVNESLLKALTFSQDQKNNIKTIFSDYKDISGNDTEYQSAIGKTVKVNENGADSKITVNIYVFYSKVEADHYFKLSQKIYENRIYLPSDMSKSQKENDQNAHRYLTSYTKSVYKDYNDIIYFPSKISYLSDVVVEDNNVIVLISENSNKPVSNKNAIIKEIISKLSQKT